MPTIATALLGLLPDIFSRVLGDKPEDLQKKLELQTELTKAILETQNQQNEVNKMEAQSSNLFVAGWRPFVGWVCGIGLALTAFRPILDVILVKFGFGHIPPMDTTELNTILMGMLGMGGMRTAEKINWVKDSVFNFKKK